MVLSSHNHTISEDLIEQPGRQGRVYLIGAGPGDPELVTVKALRLLRSADVVVYDRLIPTALLAEARSDAELLYVGKGPKKHTLPQEEINALLVSRARNGATVVRLKGGDPFVFGRGGEEALALVEAQIPFEIVPGISSAIAVPAYAGIPVTHREHTPLFTVVTGHEKRSGESSVDWQAMAVLGRLGGTIVILMGVSALPNILASLMAGGLAADTPAAVIQQGTMREQTTVVATVETLAVQAAHLGAPAITIIGTVVTLREQLAWFEQSFATVDNI